MCFVSPPPRITGSYLVDGLLTANWEAAHSAFSQLVLPVICVAIVASAPIIKQTVELFGASRCLYGSNFPIEKLWTDYTSLYQTFRRAIEQMTEAEQNDIMFNTAARLYRI